MLVPTKRWFDITGFFNSYFSEKVETTSTENSRDDVFQIIEYLSPLKKYPEMDLLLKFSALMLLLFKISVICAELSCSLTPDEDQVTKNPRESQFECGAMTENTLYAINQVRQSHITHEELESSQTKIILYIKYI